MPSGRNEREPGQLFSLTSCSINLFKASLEQRGAAGEDKFTTALELGMMGLRISSNDFFRSII